MIYDSESNQIKGELRYLYEIYSCIIKILEKGTPWSTRVK